MICFRLMLLSLLPLAVACEQASSSSDDSHADTRGTRDRSGDATQRAVRDAGRKEHADNPAKADARAESKPVDAGRTQAASPAAQAPRDESDAGTKSASGVSFDDVAPLLEKHCVGCHREQGPAPFRLDSYESASRFGEAIAAATRAGTMPPWQITSDGSCGDFGGTLQLTQEEIALIGAWVDDGTPPGARESIEIPPQPSLEGAKVHTTPAYVPTVAGGPLAESDDYHCVLIDPELTDEQFLTAYNIVPKNPQKVHHAIAYLVDPDQASLVPGLTNAALMAAHEALSPEVGWRCMVEAGEGVTVRATPATWFPGQPPMEMPNESGLRVKPSYRYVLQVHYNLAHGASGGHAGEHTQTGEHVMADAGASPTARATAETDSQVAVHFRYAETVKNEGFSVTGDGLLATLATLAPAELAPGKESVPFAWKRTMRELQMTLPSAELWAVYPHMHELGHKYRMTIQQPGEEARCAAEMQRWDFNWQRMYSFKTPMKITPDTIIDVHCDYDTSDRTEPALPGMGTSNEMCSAILYITAPLQDAP